MGYVLNREQLEKVLMRWQKDHLVYAPKRFAGGGAFSDTDLIRYSLINSADEIEFEEKSDFSFKEVLLPLSQTLFFFTEDELKESDGPASEAVILLRSCDLHAVRRLDEIYLTNGFEDYYYKRIRDKVKFVLIGCAQSMENCFCADMGTNIADDYECCINFKNHDLFEIDCRNEKWNGIFEDSCISAAEVTPDYPSENFVHVNIPEGLSPDAAKADMWSEYDSRCINCGRCNFVCPTCTCFTMQDIFYSDNGKAGERRRAAASCMTDGFTDVAGGGSYRKTNGERMRFRVLHKVYDFKKRFGYHMCVGCGRCDDICPEYISFSNAVNKLNSTVKEVSGSVPE